MLDRRYSFWVICRYCAYFKSTNNTNDFKELISKLTALISDYTVRHSKARNLMIIKFSSYCFSRKDPSDLKGCDQSTQFYLMDSNLISCFVLRSAFSGDTNYTIAQMVYGQLIKLPG
ncbi:hypothetical protein AVEN_200626-1 [Araneus ventricosus]|uniref:Uncharacterized protein n=1 Tax=Araneus ventricosus TaxID=182803 RepID=A0A4Y2SEP5_ARAVE|nr:hypothetical protein AVEN_200626-1 [Araneus ventricosus]